ncbi:MAG: hypothetical protein A2Y23_11535 [Clostridiales bacterium GWB2_37_7]|nr:MAG: hypothetical protein A2Y23_11535 [Clostridiales bacterium GWB2_37_7]
MSKIVGIDLGTSTSEIAVLENGKPRVIPNQNGEYITPSVVSIDDNGDIIVGREAKEQLLLKPNDTVIEIKRLMGSGTKVTMGGKEYTPEKISSYILKYLIACAEKHLNEKIERAVITVPAYFSDEQRKATVEAGRLAGLKVERIINEPTAASLDYGIEHMRECKNILIYDLGGGTLDVTILEMFEGILDVKASSGNNKLGGKDFDQSLIDYLLNRFNQTYGIDVSSDKRAAMRLKEAVETCKIALSTENEYNIILPFFAEVKGTPVSLEETVNREIFEGLIKHMIESTEEQIGIALKDSGIKPSDIDLILLVGGSTRIPYVRRFVEKVLGKEPQQLVDPDLAVVRGASIQAGIINNEFSSEVDIMITDVCPYTLGTSILDYIGGFSVADVYDIIIPRNVTIPVVREKIYGTAQNDQSEVAIEVYQGECKKASMNNLLGKFHLKGVPPAPAFQEKIKVMFSYDINGILQVEASIVSTGKKANITVETTGVGIAAEVDLEGWENISEARRYRAIIKKANRILENREAGPYEIDLESLIMKIKEALVLGKDRDILDKLKDELADIIYDITEEEND